MRYRGPGVSAEADALVNSYLCAMGDPLYDFVPLNPDEARMATATADPAAEADRLVADHGYLKSLGGKI